MTVSYTGDVANGSHFGCFWKILGRWRGSVYKLIWRELIAYLCLYFMINSIYRLGMTEEQRRTFEKVKVYCSKQIESIPMSFVLGFYVSLIVKRWWDQYWILPMPDSLALYISAGIHGQDERGRILRRTIMRYAMLAYIICLQRISFRVKKRFPTLEHLVDTGLMMESEKKIFDMMDQKTKVLKFWMPVVWASNLVNRARQEGRIQSDHMVQTIVTELSDFRRKLGRVMVYDTVSVPLVYTQVVTLAVYTYFVAALIGRQWVTPPDRSTIYPGYELDLYFPIFLSLQFIFYIGWLKVAETLINPFGEDDDDFELNWLIDRHIKVSYMVVDEMHEEHPELLKDQYWEQKVPQDLPYNLASEHFRRHEPQGSTASLKVKPSESVYADLTSVKRHSVIPDEVYADYESVTDSPLPDARKSWIQRQWSRVGSLRSTSSSSSRNRAHSHGHGALPTSMPQHSSGHRPSLYERILSRRSSKDNRNSSRFLPHRALNGTLTISKDGGSAFMPNPNSRPRVPTPDVTKENPMNALSPLDTLPSRAVFSKEASTMNYGVGYGTTNITPTSIPSIGMNGGVHGSNNLALLSHVTAPSSISTREAMPPPYDPILERVPSPTLSALHGGTILSPIAENDGSPYSTSSTARSYKSSNYPTTTAIFGRKTSPPPSDELPPIPSQSVSSSSVSGSSNSSVNSEKFIVKQSRRKYGRRQSIDNKLDLSPSKVIDELEAVLKETVLDGRINEAFEDDEDENGDDTSRAYMTIAEISESKAELEKNLQSQHNSRNNSPQAQPSISSPPNLPRPRQTQGATGSRARTLNQNSKAIKEESSEKLRNTNASLPLNGHSSPTLDTEDDDGYDERGSYNEDDDSNNGSLSSIQNTSLEPSKLAPQIHPRGGSYDKSTSTDDVAATSPPVSPVESHFSELNPISANDDDAVLLLPTNKRRKSNEKVNNESINKGNEDEDGNKKNKDGKVGKDCEVFV